MILMMKDENIYTRCVQKLKGIYYLIGLLNCLLLTGCTGTTYSSHFDCPMGEGAGCASISRVNKMIDRHEIDLGNDDIPLAKKGTCENQLVNNQPTTSQVYVYYGPDQLGRLISAESPIREEGI